jgi:hypothetical protein
MAGLLVQDHAADVVVDREEFLDLEGGCVDAVDDRRRVGTVLGHRQVDVAVGDVEATGVVAVPLPEDDVAQQVPLTVEHEEVAYSLARRTVVAVDRLGVARCRFDNLDRGEVDPVLGHLHCLWVEGVEVERDRRCPRPCGAARHVVEGGDQIIISGPLLRLLLLYRGGGRGADKNAECGQDHRGESDVHERSSLWARATCSGRTLRGR